MIFLDILRIPAFFHSSFVWHEIRYPPKSGYPKKPWWRKHIVSSYACFGPQNDLVPAWYVFFRYFTTLLFVRPSFVRHETRYRPKSGYLKKTVIGREYVLDQGLFWESKSFDSRIVLYFLGILRHHFFFFLPWVWEVHRMWNPTLFKKWIF